MASQEQTPETHRSKTHHSKTQSSERRIAANRRNALRSTGPTTPEGKARSARNSIRHGLRAAQVLIGGESEQEFREMKQSMLAALRPVGALEDFLAARVMTAYWRLSRIPRMEQELFAASPLHLAGDDPGPGAIFRAEGRGGADAFARLARYEREIEHGMFRALHELQRLQAHRNGMGSGPPIALDLLVDTPPAIPAQ